MTYEVYNYIFIGAAVASGILLVLSIVLAVINKLTGLNNEEKEGN